MAETPSVHNTAQLSENARKKSFLNYETAALPAELRRHGAAKHCIHGQSEQASESRQSLPASLKLRLYAAAMAWVPQTA
jgi:hypothetical protein